MSGTVAFRVEAGPVTGFGHLGRCVALAQQLADNGVRTVFCTGATGDFATQRLATARAETAAPAGRTGSAEDAARFAEVARQAGADWLVVDGYDFDGAYLSALRQGPWKLLVIDDNMRLPAYPAEILVDQNFGAESLRYVLPPGGQALLGPRYALLDRRFRGAGAQKEQPQQVRRVLVTTGGTDPHNLTVRMLPWLLKAAEEARFDVVVGPASPAISSLQETARADPRVSLHTSPPGLFDLMRSADIAITAGGTTLWELAALGVPALVVLIADNQRPHTTAMAGQGIIRLLGWHADLTEQSVTAALNSLMNDYTARSQMSRAAREIVDGHGAERVAGEMFR